MVDYAVVIALIASIVGAAWVNRNFDRLIDGVDGGNITFRHSSSRPWNVELTNELDANGKGRAALMAVPIVLFFFLDQNFSSIICQKPCMKLEKGHYYHSTLACMAGFNILGPL